MKRLGHVAVYVSDIEKSRRFYEEVVGLKHSETRGGEDHNALKDLNITLCFLSCGHLHHDFVLVEKKDGRGDPVEVGGYSLMHLAFELEAEKTIEEFSEYVRKQGIEIAMGPVMHDREPVGDGTWGGNHSVYFRDPDGHDIEVYQGMDDFVENIIR
ncbi:VOC family protein [Pseudomaricurvus alkylphenolicus]|uniref:VOC family protein n=1 Tax=Pseudomaricurvus alkylphenolicus TaxID=1306991 RepID=UPI001421B6C9|nr:VOC family protein [Pseudomaricurvus alkylphenolicus]NIB40839.1 VOC family protein [Pseudomaricurvus alkylphenolicus]